MTTSQPPDSPSPGTGPAHPTDRGASSPSPATVRPAVLAGAVLALLTYLCGFFGASEFSFSLMLVLAGGILALIGLLPKVGRVLVPAALLASIGFFSLLLQATSTASVGTSGAVRWIALALGLFSAAAIVAALMFDAGVLTAPAPRPARGPAPQQGGWAPYGQPGYGAPGQPQQPGAPGQPGVFDPNHSGYGGQPGYGAPGSYGGYGAPGYPGYAGAPGHAAQQPGYGPPGHGAAPSSTGGYGAVGAGGYGGAQGYGAQGYGSQGYPASAGYGAPAYGAAYQPGASGYGAPSGTGDQGAAGQGQATQAAPAAGSAAQGPGAQPAFGTPSTTPGGSGTGASAAGTPGGQTPAPGGDGTPEATTPGVPAGGGETHADGDDDRTRSFRAGDGSSGSGS